MPPSPASEALRAAPLPVPNKAGNAAEPGTGDPAPRRNRFSVSRTAGTMPVYTPKALAASFAPNVTASVEAGQKMGFSDMIDVLNPLQHIPVIGTLYRNITGDTISAPAQFMGGMLFGGPVGAAAAMTDVAFREQTGTSFGDRMLASVKYNKNGDSAQVADTPADTLAGTPAAQLASRWIRPERMAGTQPVWNNSIPETPSTLIAAQTLGNESGFALLLNRLSDRQPT